MASLKLLISIDNSHEFKADGLLVKSFRLSAGSSASSFSGYLNVAGACKFGFIRVSRLDTEYLEISDLDFAYDLDSDSAKDCRVEGLVSNGPKLYWDFPRERFNIWKRYRDGKIIQKDSKFSKKFRRNTNRRAKEDEPWKNSVEDNVNSEDSVEIGVSIIDPKSRPEYCNVVLRELVNSSDCKALRFFEWMKVNGKLRHNIAAYNLILRVLTRRGEWDEAEELIEKMTVESGSFPNFQVFNTLIYACYKRGLVDLGTKWFHTMLEKGVQPNIATFGMLMSLYQRGWSAKQAEIAFSKMRDLKITCPSAYSAMITIYTRLGLYNKAEEVIGLMKEDAITLNKENWLVQLNAFCQQGRLDKAEEVLHAMQDAGFKPNIVAYNMMITGYGKLSRMDDAEELFCRLEKFGLKPDETTFRSMIEGWGRAENHEEAKRYYAALKRLGLRPNSSNLCTMLNLQAKHQDDKSAFITVDEMLMLGCQKSSVLGILLKAYEKANLLHKIPSLLKGSLYDHVLKNQTSCSILVMAYVKSGLTMDTIHILQKKLWEDPIFEENLYHLLICTCKDLGTLEDARKIFTSMPRSKKPNLHIFCTMIDIYTSMDKFDDAVDLYLKIKHSDVCLDLIAYTVVVKMYVKYGYLKEASLVLEDMEKQNDIVPDVYLLRDMLRLYQKLGELEKLADLYYRTVKIGVFWDQDMYNCVINCCARALPVDELSRLFDEMLHRGFEPNTTTLNVLLDVYGKSRLLDKLRKVFGMAKRRDLVDDISFNTMIAAYGRIKDFSMMSSTVQKMQFNGFSVSLEAYNCMLDAYGKEGEMEKFRDVLQRIKESNCVPDHYTYNIMINIYGERGWIEEIAGVLEELKKSGVQPDLCSYNTLIKAYGIAGMVEDAVAVLREMRKHGIEPDCITYTNLINALKRNDMYLEAVKWSLWMKQMGM